MPLSYSCIWYSGVSTHHNVYYAHLPASSLNALIWWLVPCRLNYASEDVRITNVHNEQRSDMWLSGLACPVIFHWLFIFQALCDEQPCDIHCLSNSHLSVKLSIHSCCLSFKLLLPFQQFQKQNLDQKQTNTQGIRHDSRSGKEKIGHPKTEYVASQSTQWAQIWLSYDGHEQPWEGYFAGDSR
jgi:hypothetical protein